VLDAHAVDQNERLGAAAAAQRQRGEGGSYAAVLLHLESGLGAQQRRQVDGLRVADVLLREDRRVGDRVTEPLLGARGGDDHRIVLRRRLRNGQRGNERGQQRRAPAYALDHFVGLPFS